MTNARIESRTTEFMGMHKGDLARLLAHAEYALGHPVEELLGAGAEPAMEQGTDPEIADVPAASTEPEPLEPASETAASVEGADAAPAGEAKETPQ